MSMSMGSHNSVIYHATEANISAAIKPSETAWYSIWAELAWANTSEFRGQENYATTK